MFMGEPIIDESGRSASERSDASAFTTSSDPSYGGTQGGAAGNNS
jgi:hypothetical protein